MPGSGGECVKAVCYMDDVTFVCSSETDARRAELQLSLFASVSGLNVSWQKSQICMLSGSGVLREVKVKVVDTLVILGTQFKRDLLNQANAEKELEKIQKKVDFLEAKAVEFNREGVGD